MAKKPDTSFDFGAGAAKKPKFNGAPRSTKGKPKTIGKSHGKKSATGGGS
jgi:hypothetical protein